MCLPDISLAAQCRPLMWINARAIDPVDCLCRQDGESQTGGATRPAVLWADSREAMDLA
jgi:hypothetical protein